MFERNRIPAFVETKARFAARKVAQPQAAMDVPAHIAAEWTGEQERPQSAAERIRALLA